jgi:hypothetical protein
MLRLLVVEGEAFETLRGHRLGGFLLHVIRHDVGAVVLSWTPRRLRTMRRTSSP